MLTSAVLHAAAPNGPVQCKAFAHNRLVNSASITISWVDNSTNETAWRVAMSTDNGATFVWLANAVNSSTTSSTGATLTNTWVFAQLNRTYVFKVAALNASDGNFSNVATVNTSELGAPFNFSLTTSDSFNVSMRWEEASTSESGYSIERRVGAGAWTVLSPTIAANTLVTAIQPYTTPSTEYSFRIRAYAGGAPTTPDSSAGSSSVSPYSPVVTFTTAAYNLSAAAVPGQTQINLSWPNILNETGYQVFMRRSGDIFFTLQASLPANSTSYQATSPAIAAATTYQFFVQPVNGSTIMGQSSVATVLVDGITSIAGASGLPGESFSHSFTHASSGSVVSRSLTGVPSGLAFNASSGVLSGTCPAPGVYPMNYSLTLSNGGVLTQTFSLRVRPPAGAPVVATIIPDWNGSAGSQRNSALAAAFTDVEAESAVRVSTNLGDMDFVLYNNATPATVSNFMSYVNSGKYHNVAFHRSVPDFVIQTGGFTGTGTGSNFTSVVTSPPVVNEPGISNLRGTISLAKLGGNPNSATSQFFVNVDDNSANLNFQNGGFTVFGRVAGDGMAVADAINTLPRATYSLFLNGSPTASTFPDFPMNAPAAPPSMDQANLVKILSVSSIPTLTHSITGNSRPGVAAASIVNGELRIDGFMGGQTTITITATDLDNLTATQNVAVTLTDTFNSWAARTPFPNGESGPLQNPDGDGLNNLLEYALFGNPAQSSQSEVPTMGSTATGPTTSAMTIQFPVRKFTSGLAYVVQANNQLTGEWTDLWNSSQGFTHAQVVSADEQADRTVVTIKDTVQTGSQPTRFLRVKVMEN